MRKPIRYLGILSAVALLAAACNNSSDTGGGGDGGGGTTKKIDVTVYGQGAWTGDYNYLVLSSFQAAELHFQELSDDPDFPANITLEQADTQGDPEQAAGPVETAVGDPNTVAIIGPGFSGESEASGDTYNEAAIPFITQSATNPGLADKGWDYWYRTIANDDDQGTPAGEYIVNTLGAQNVYVLDDKSTYGQGLADVVASVVEDNGGSVVGDDSIEPTEDYSSALSDVESSGADALFYGGYDAQTGLIIQQARDAGLDIPIVSGDGSVSSTLVDLAGDSLTDVYLTCPCNLEGAGDFLTEYQAAYSGSEVPIYAAEGYDVAGLIGEGIKAAIDGGATDPVDIREGIKTYLDGLTEDAPYEGVAKTIAFDENHELAGENRTDLIFLYETSPGSISLLGSATDVLAG